MADGKTSWEKVYRDGDTIVVERNNDDGLTMSFDKATTMAEKLNTTDPRKMMLERALSSKTKPGLNS